MIPFIWVLVIVGLLGGYILFKLFPYMAMIVQGISFILIIIMFIALPIYFQQSPFIEVMAEKSLVILILSLSLGIGITISEFF